MGLDQFAHTIDNEDNKTEIAYWRKHPSLHDWMEDLWASKGRPGMPEKDEEDKVNPFQLSPFNCIPLELSKEDIDSLERAVKAKMLPETQGFFFGDDASEHYYEDDLKFCRQARQALDEGLKVVYDSWW